MNALAWDGLAVWPPTGGVFWEKNSVAWHLASVDGRRGWVLDGMGWIDGCSLIADSTDRTTSGEVAGTSEGMISEPSMVVWLTWGFFSRLKAAEPTLYLTLLTC